MDLEAELIRAANLAEHAFDEARRRYHDASGWRIPLRVVAYRGYGTKDRVLVRGRVVRDRGIEASRADDGTWENLVAAWRRYATHEIGGARVRIEVGGRDTVAVTDAEGFFRAEIDVDARRQGASWCDASLALLDPPAQRGRTRERGRVLVVGDDAELGVISDIDDTVIRMGAASKLRRLRALFLDNARERRTFEGAPAFYRALERGGRSGAGTANPLFFVSSSPWNLHDHLLELFDLAGMPEAPIFLRDWGLAPDGFRPNGRHDDKLAPARELLARYPRLPFVLVGDSGQHDPALYATLVDEHPGRIAAVYIRIVASSPRRQEAGAAAIVRMRDAGIDVVTAEDTSTLAAHAASRGFILPGAP